MNTTSFTAILRRHAAQQSGFSHVLAVVLVVLLTLLILALLLIAGLLFMRQRRRSRKHEVLPLYADKRVSTSSTSSHRRVLVRPSESIYLYHEKPGHGASSSDPPSPSSELPEIRITFPEELDASGKRQSGRVVVVRVGDTGVGLEPVAEDLPAYGAGDRFQSLDLDRIGGLVEKPRGTPQRLS
ncbi:hypothetical protein B0A54_09896 [Friedmanniomyces endolithicus]|uniref:Uncharacterized protein n=1 Tax=Friedmanniomyces endolithicus TaxID=329885 RepID=A0A4U0USD6_9PEZI|nr:hypothetical protein LTS09_011895 [Friedmanniomyces endolithicus]TKA38847.1 hypothetical protein B0A54_09896 [Friedmanniomyces endolithicus]